MINSLKKKFLQSKEEDKRTLHRIPNMQQKYFRCVLKTNKRDIDGIIIDLTSSGLAIEINEEFFFEEGIQLNEIDVFYAKKRITTFRDFKIIRKDVAKKFLAVEVIQGETHRGLRTTHRLNLNTKFLPQITGADPLKPHEKLIFVIHEITKDGMRISTSFRNKHIMQGMKFKNFDVHIPGEGNFSINFEVKFIKPKDGSLTIGAQIFDAGNKLKEAFSRLAFFAAIPKAANAVEAIEIIRKANFSLRKIADSVRVDVVHTEEEFLQALQVRLEAYKAASKISKETTVEQMQDKYDEQSITYIGKINDKVIATFRFTESDGPGKPFPLESYYNYDKYIKVDRKDVYEVSKLGILPAFLGTDLTIAIFRAVALDVARSKKSMAILSTNQLKKMYFELGATQISDEVDHPVIPNEKLNLLFLNVNDYIFGARMKEKTWHKIVKGNIDLLFRFGFLEKRSLKKNFKVLKGLLRKKQDED